jgi:GH15 family glucan-1,4-alpha-glucosidase
MALRIEDYALIGDLSTAALVGRDGSIDWLCWPRFDSDACFAALLGNEKNGHWRIAPKGPSRCVSRRYRPGTLILETLLETPDGRVTLIDFMPKRGRNSHIVRIVAGESGRVAMHMRFVLRFGWGTVIPWVSRTDDETLRCVAGPDMVVLRTGVKLHGENMHTVGDFTVGAGETAWFVLTHCASHEPDFEYIDATEALADAERRWHEWSGRNKLGGAYHAEVTRSLITLKALIYYPTGGMVAAPTTSLPEMLGGERNWDYRYCWLRDATFTLLAFMNAGYYEEAGAWRDWLLRAVAGSPHQMQIMYGIAGERRLTEWEVPWLSGYEGASPVRIGNAAHGQLQLDVYGEIMDALHQAREGGLVPSDSGWQVEKQFLEHLDKIWTQPDEGIWEVRGPPRHFTYSKVMAWVAFDRGIRSAEKFGLKGPVAQWRATRKTIHADVCAKGYDAARGAFVQSYGASGLDASLLLMPAVGFLPADDPRIRGTIDAIERELIVDGLVRRYHTHEAEDGLPVGEGAFLACSFWLVDAYLLIGRLDDAKALFERLLALANDVGLLSEEYDTEAKRLVGNFPQAFSHLALINAATNLEHGLRTAAQRSHQHDPTPAQSPA